MSKMRLLNVVTAA